MANEHHRRITQARRAATRETHQGFPDAWPGESPTAGADAIRKAQAERIRGELEPLEELPRRLTITDKLRAARVVWEIYNAIRKGTWKMKDTKTTLMGVGSLLTIAGAIVTGAATGHWQEAIAAAAGIVGVLQSIGLIKAADSTK